MKLLFSAKSPKITDGLTSKAYYGDQMDHDKGIKYLRLGTYRFVPIVLFSFETKFRNFYEKMNFTDDAML